MTMEKTKMVNVAVEKRIQFRINALEHVKHGFESV